MQIVVVENVKRHLHLPENKNRSNGCTIEAVDEIGNPTILATLTVIAAILPMAFVGGLWRLCAPFPSASAITMILMIVAFIVTPGHRFI